MYEPLNRLREVEEQNPQLYAELAKAATKYVTGVARKKAFPNSTSLATNIPDITPFKNLIKKAGFKIEGLEELTEEAHAVLGGLAFTITERVVMNRTK